MALRSKDFAPVIGKSRRAAEPQLQQRTSPSALRPRDAFAHGTTLQDTAEYSRLLPSSLLNDTGTDTDTDSDYDHDHDHVAGGFPALFHASCLNLNSVEYGINMNSELALSEVTHHDSAQPSANPPIDSNMEGTVDAPAAPSADTTSTATPKPTSTPPPALDKSQDEAHEAHEAHEAAVSPNNPVVDASALPPADMPAMSLPPMPSLDAPISLSTDMSMGLASDFSMMNPGLPMDMDMDMTGFAPPPAEQRLSAFARLRFDDGSYYMHTYQIILGRNVELAHKDMRRFAKADQLAANGEPQRADAVLNGKRRRKDRVGARSVISEAGGIVNAPVQMMPMAYQQRRQSIASQALSTGAAPQAEVKEPEHAPQDLIMQAFPEAPDALDSHAPENPNDCPLVPIHPQNIKERTGLRGPKGISRQHAKIFYDFDNGNFCLVVLGSNGLFHDGNFLAKGACVELNHGDTITVGMVEMTFFLPDIALTEEQLARGPGSESQSRPMSFSFENGQGESEELNTSASEEDNRSINPRHVYHQPHLWDESDSDDMPDVDDLDDEDQYSPVPRPKPSLKIKLKTKSKGRVPPPKPSKPAHKRKHVREPSPEDPPVKKMKLKTKDSHKDPPKEKEKDKERDKEKGKATKIPSVAPAKTPSKSPAKFPTKAPAKAPSKAPAKTVNDEPPSTMSPSTEAEALKLTPTPMPGPAPAISSTESPDATRKSAITLVDPADVGDVGDHDLIDAEFARKYNLPEVLIGQVLPRRKGPGRPPKDGMMSKRQKSQLVKRGKEIEKAQAAGIDPADLPQPMAKPKIARRKESNAGDDDDIRETTERGDVLGTPGDKKQPKPSKPARTPSPELRITDFTEEQLARPTSNYVVLIHEAISSAASGQMNLQQIYNYIEKTYPWYKFKTTTSGWQSSVRHNLGQHDAFVKGDKEGKGYMWRINPNVSIEKERRKRQVSPPQVNHAQRQGGYYPPPPNGYPHYGQPGYYPGMPPHGLPPNGPPRPPPAEPPQPRLPPSMARNAGSTATAAPTSAPAPSPYASPWAGGNIAGSPPAPNAPRPYPPPNAQSPSVTSAPYSSGQYGVLYPTSAPPGSYGSHTTASPYGNHYAATGPSPYGPPPNRSHMPYPPPPANPGTPSAMAPNTQAQPTPAASSQPAAPPHQDNHGIPHPSGRYPLSTHPDLIRQLEAFRTVYLQTRIEAGEDLKVNNAIRAYVTPELIPTLTTQEHNLLSSIQTIPRLRELKAKSGDAGKEAVTKQENETATQEAPATTATATAAAIAADAAANTIPSNPTSASEPHKFTPDMTGQAPGPSATPAPASNLPPQPATIATTQRPSVEPLTPVPGSPAIQMGAPRPAVVEPASVPSTQSSAALPPAPSSPAPTPVYKDTNTGAQELAQPAAAAMEMTAPTETTPMGTAPAPHIASADAPSTTPTPATGAPSTSQNLTSGPPPASENLTR